MRSKPVLNQEYGSFSSDLFGYRFSGYHMVLYNMYKSHLSHCTYIAVVYLCFNIMIRILWLYQKQNVAFQN